MARWTPDPSFYPSPRLAMEAPQEELALRGAAQSGRLRRPPGRPRRARPRGGLLDVRRARRASSTCRTPATSSTTSAGTPAAPRSAPGRRTRTSSAATWWCPGCAPRASTSSTWATIPRAPSIAKVIEPEELIHKTGYSRPHTSHCGPEGIYMSALGRRRERRRAGRHLPPRLRELRPARAVGGRPRAPALRLRLLVAPRLRHAHLERVGHAGHVRERASSRRSCSAASTATSCTSGTCARRRHRQALDLGDEHQMVLELRPAHDPRRTVRLRRRGRVAWRTCAPRSGSGRAGPTARSRRTKVIEIPAEPADPDELPPRSRTSAPCRRSSPTSTCRSTTASCTSPAGAPASCASTTCPTRPPRSSPARCELGGIVRRARAPGVRAAQRRAADGRGEPRRAPRLPHELALLLLGRAVLPGRARTAGSRRSTPSRTAASRVDPDFLVTDFDGRVRTRCASRAATPRPTRTASRRSPRWPTGRCWRSPRSAPRTALNPAMGWLFAVAIGLQERSRGALGALAACRSRSATRPRWRSRCSPSSSRARAAGQRVVGIAGGVTLIASAPGSSWRRAATRAGWARGSAPASSSGGRS